MRNIAREARRHTKERIKAVSVSAPPPERLQWFYEEMARSREDAMKYVGQVFTHDIIYKDPFRETSGVADFEKLFTSLFKKWPKVWFTEFSRIGSNDAFTLTYVMNLKGSIGPSFAQPMASIARANPEGLIYDLRDYFDFPTSLVSPSRIFTGLYHGFAKLFL
jgi:hypothetical protein